MSESSITTDGQGGRERIARFIIDHEAALRRRIGAEVRGSPGLDADEVFSTTIRRVDYAAAKGSFEMRSDPEAWGFVARVLRRAVQRHRRKAARLAEAIASFAAELRPAGEPDLRLQHERHALASLLGEMQQTRPQDAELVQMRLRGRKWRDISAATGVSEDALRQRWSALLARLRSRASHGGGGVPRPGC